MASFGVEQDVPPGTTLTVNGVLQIASPAQISTLNTGVSSGSLLASFQTLAANSATTQAAGTPVTATGTVAVSSGGAGYSITLPPAVPGMAIEVVLTSATNTVKVFPSAAGTGSEAINALAANAAITMAALTSATFLCVAAGQWYTSPRVPS